MLRPGASRLSVLVSLLLGACGGGPGGDGPPRPDGPTVFHVDPDYPFFDEDELNEALASGYCAPPEAIPVGDSCMPSCAASGGNVCVSEGSTACDGLELLPSWDCEVCCARDDAPAPPLPPADCEEAGGNVCTDPTSDLCEGRPLIPSADCLVCCHRPELDGSSSATPGSEPQSEASLGESTSFLAASCVFAKQAVAGVASPATLPASAAGPAFHYFDEAAPKKWDEIQKLAAAHPRVQFASNKPLTTLPLTSWTGQLGVRGKSLEQVKAGLAALVAAKPAYVMMDELAGESADVLGNLLADPELDTLLTGYAGRWGAFVAPNANLAHDKLAPVVSALLGKGAIIAYEWYPEESDYCMGGKNDAERDAWLRKSLQGDASSKRLDWLLKRRSLLGSTSPLSVILAVGDRTLSDATLAAKPARVMLDRMLYVLGQTYPELVKNGGPGGYKWSDASDPLGSAGDWNLGWDDGRDRVFALSVQQYSNPSTRNEPRLGSVPCSCKNTSGAKRGARKNALARFSPHVVAHPASGQAWDPPSAAWNAIHALTQYSGAMAASEIVPDVQSGLVVASDESHPNTPVWGYTFGLEYGVKSPPTASPEEHGKDLASATYWFLHPTVSQDRYFMVFDELDPARPKDLQKAQVFAADMKARVDAKMDRARQVNLRWGMFLPTGPDVDYADANPASAPAIDAVLAARGAILPKLYVSRATYCAKPNRDQWLLDRVLLGNSTTRRLKWLDERRQASVTAKNPSKASRVVPVFAITDAYAGLDDEKAVAFFDHLLWTYYNKLPKKLRSHLSPGNGGPGTWKWGGTSTSSDQRDELVAKVLAHYRQAARRKKHYTSVDPCK